MNEKAIIRIEDPCPIQCICRINNNKCNNKTYSIVIGNTDIFGNETTTSITLCSHHLYILQDLINQLPI